MAVNVDEAVVAKVKKEGKTFEILVDPRKAAAFINGNINSIEEVIASEEIYSDARKGSRASENDILKIFGTKNKLEVCSIIVKEGIVPVTVDMKRKELEQKKKQIADLIHKTAVDPNSGKPHPQQRIENAMAEARVKVENKPAEQQVKDVIDKIKKVLPIKYEIREILVKIPQQFAGKSFSVLKHYGKFLNEKWLEDGSLSAALEIPAGLQEDLEVDLNRLTKGNVEVVVTRKK